MKLIPVGDHIIVKAVSREETSASGIIIPDTIDKERSERGEVIAVGPGRELDGGKRSTMEVSVGNKVLFKKYAPDEVKIDGAEYLIIRMDDVMAIIE
ncbi:MAG: 10 kDa chaperonin [Candidatus Uhrbacteria bacterium GW2011_GWF2_39_13]|uniref:Co-chaperonin GroES n=1 Tax=Candidatus Uhrbacteria bacterium GW2011_GWF2_39_13 TaxID=1618995 RepID=A0A0G0MI73_9BACT|nr:MAG: 10 kDa chaperonin [Candidatus Uhrbacteria bacterium GW2011_GWF2_39_13]